MSEQLNNRTHPQISSAPEAVAVNAVTSVSSPAGESEPIGIARFSTEQLIQESRRYIAMPERDRDTPILALAYIRELGIRAATPTGGRSGDWRKDPNVKTARGEIFHAFATANFSGDTQIIGTAMDKLCDAVARSAGGRSEAPEGTTHAG